MGITQKNEGCVTLGGSRDIGTLPHYFGSDPK
jgi:hypothetical protein